jgi:hypothetical protein
MINELRIYRAMSGRLPALISCSQDPSAWDEIAESRYERIGTGRNPRGTSP